mgnify:CR=1 FL=1
MKTHPKPFPEITPPADAEEAVRRMAELFSECERSARRYFARAEEDGLDFDMRCAYAGVASRMVRAAALVAAAIGKPPGAETVHRVIVERA